MLRPMSYGIGTDAGQAVMFGNVDEDGNLCGTPGYGLTLRCALGLLVGGTIQVPQLQLQLQ